MSLQDTNSIRFFSRRCQELWRTWRTGANAAARAIQRQGKIQATLRTITGFMPPMNIQFVNLNGDCGSFAWGSWRLSIDSTYTGNDSITYKDFVELCRTAYHESRHAEQFYRIAQGLALGKLSFPDKSRTQAIQDFTKLGLGGGGVRAKIALFEGKAMQTNVASRQMIARWLNIPQNVAGTAVTAKMGFASFIKSKPAWFKRQTALAEVEEWMRSTYKRTLGSMNEWAQSDHGPFKIYRDLPEEHDAHEIERVIKQNVTQLIGHNYHTNKLQPRSNTALFGN